MQEYDSKDFAMEVAELALSKRAYDIKVMELKKRSTIADYFIVCSADSDVQVKAVSDYVWKELRDRGIKTSRMEGQDSLNWVILDYFDVVLHVFKKDAREFYNLEKLWGDVPVTEVKDEEENPGETN